MRPGSVAGFRKSPPAFRPGSASAEIRFRIFVDLPGIEDLAFRFPTRLRVLLGCSRVSTLSPGQFICEDDIVSTKCTILEHVLLVHVVKRTANSRLSRSDLTT